MEDPRTTSARDHDDRAIIDAADDAPSASGRSGGSLQQDIATAAEADAVGDPDGSMGVEKAMLSRTSSVTRSILPAARERAAISSP